MSNDAIQKLIGPDESDRDGIEDVRPGEERADFSEVKRNYKQDITHVDSRLTQLQSYITTLNSQAQNLKTLIQNEKDPSKRAKQYQILNECLELIATFEGLYLKAMEVKFRYRKEQTDFIVKKAKYIEIELAKLTADDKASDLNTAKLVEMLQSFERMVLEKAGSNGEPAALPEAITKIDDEEKYKL